MFKLKTVVVLVLQCALAILLHWTGDVQGWGYFEGGLMGVSFVYLSGFIKELIDPPKQPIAIVYEKTLDTAGRTK